MYRVGCTALSTTASKHHAVPLDTPSLVNVHAETGNMVEVMGKSWRDLGRVISGRGGRRRVAAALIDAPFVGHVIGAKAKCG